MENNDKNTQVPQSLKTAVMPRFLKAKYTMEELEEYIIDLSCRNERFLNRSKLDDILKLIKWRKKYDAQNGA